jgi:hypothetical protein
VANANPTSVDIENHLNCRQSFGGRVLPLRTAARARRAECVRVGRPAAHRRHPGALLPADGPALVLPPRGRPARRLHHRPGRRRRRGGAVQQDPGRHPRAQGARRLRPLPRHPAGAGLLPAPQRRLQVPQVLELVPPLGGQAGALLRRRQHRARDPRRRRRQLMEDRIRLQPGRPPRRRRRARVHAVDEVVQEQHRHPDVLGTCCCTYLVVFPGSDDVLCLPLTLFFLLLVVVVYLYDISFGTACNRVSVRSGKCTATARSYFVQHAWWCSGFSMILYLPRHVIAVSDIWRPLHDCRLCRVDFLHTCTCGHI